MFITFEGIDGCGKTTQWELLRARLESLGASVVATREPGGTKLAETIRTFLLEPTNSISQRAELLLFIAARAQHVEEVISPALKAKQTVLCDRFTDSTTAYQGGGLHIDLAQIARLNALATGGLTPNLTLLFDVEVEIAQRRRAEMRGEDRIEARGLPFQERVRQTYLEIARREPQRVIVINADAPAKIVHNHVVRVLENRNLWPQKLV